eukprot:766595-Hanusia_phi.AAC.7
MMCNYAQKCILAVSATKMMSGWDAGELGWLARSNYLIPTFVFESCEAPETSEVIPEVAMFAIEMIDVDVMCMEEMKLKRLFVETGKTENNKNFWEGCPRFPLFVVLKDIHLVVFAQLHSVGRGDRKGKSFQNNSPCKGFKAAVSVRRSDTILTTAKQPLLTVRTGTHSFHNFTSGKKKGDADAKRYIGECSYPTDGVAVPCCIMLGRWWFVLSCLVLSYLILMSFPVSFKVGSRVIFDDYEYLELKVEGSYPSCARRWLVLEQSPLPHLQQVTSPPAFPASDPVNRTNKHLQPLDFEDVNHPGQDGRVQNEDGEMIGAVWELTLSRCCRRSLQGRGTIIVL